MRISDWSSDVCSADLYRPARFVGLGEGGAEARVVRIANDAGEHALRTRLLVAADGTRSGVRDALGIEADSHDYLQTLFVARLRAARAPDGPAYDRPGDTSGGRRVGQGGVIQVKSRWSPYLLKKN